MVGRGSRPTANKSAFTILDFGENVHRLGFWQEARDWGKAFAGMENKKGQGVAPVKDCPCCGAVLYASARFCEFCGEVFAIEKKAERGSLELMAYEKLNGRYLFEIAKTPADLWELKSRKNYKQAFIERVLYYANYSELRRFWDAKGYTQGYTNRREREFAEGGAVKNFIVKL
jgi:predicted nucleic acid-binding Zn ribbon protein